MKKIVLAFAIWLAAAGIALAAVNVNTATKDELISIKGIGEKRAQAIIDYRTKNGPFKTVDDLEKVPGIGPGLMKQIKPNVSVSGPTTIDKSASSTKSKSASDDKKTTTKSTDTGKTSTNTKTSDTSKGKSDTKTSNTTATK
ncbi:MAG TPA: helix-hairpin-helix domain-containing protein [Candidatus Binatia bacterium]|jgi:competence protein ComEA